VAIALGTSGEVRAQSATSAVSEATTSSRARLDLLFADVIREPANADLTLQYARVATEIGDYEAAITAMERLQFLNPSLSQVSLELGVLYYRIGSNGLARSYLTKALKTPDLSPENQALIQRYLLDIDKLTRQNRFSADIFAGVMHQSNANLGPGSSSISLPAGVVSLSSTAVKRSDQALATSGAALYSYDLQDQDRTTIEVSGQLCATKHFRVRDFDLMYTEITAGPRTTFATYDITGFNVHPYVIADFSLLGGSTLFHAFGTGIDAEKVLRPNLKLKGVFEFRDKRYGTGAGRVTASNLSGNEHNLALQLSYAITPAQTVSVTGSFIDVAARSQASANRQLGLSGTYQIAYAPPFDIPSGHGAWQTAVSAGRSIANYNAPDPAINASQARFDHVWRLAFTEVIPVAEAVSLSFQLQRDIVSSTIPLFAYTNTTVMLGAQVRF